jgi:hypothetical protein
MDTAKARRAEVEVALKILCDGTATTIKYVPQQSYYNHNHPPPSLSPQIAIPAAIRTL